MTSTTKVMPGLASKLAPLDLEKELPTSKPLPSPPAASTPSLDGRNVPRTLLDASDQPLHRTPPGKPTDFEEWPVMIPEKTSEEKRAQPPIAQESSFQSGYQHGNIERYPRMASMETPKPSSKGPGRTEHRQRVSVAASSELAQARYRSFDVKRKPVVKHVDQDSPHLHRQQMATTHMVSSAAPHHPDMSAKAAAVEKAHIEKSSSISRPRQTKTSALRARISSGTLHSGGPMAPKVTGFTDFTSRNVTPESADSRSGSKDIFARSNVSVRVANRSVSTRAQVQAKGNGSSGQAVPDIKEPAIQEPVSHFSDDSDASAESVKGAKAIFSKFPRTRSSKSLPKTIQPDKRHSSKTQEGVSQSVGIRSVEQLVRRSVNNQASSQDEEEAPG